MAQPDDILKDFRKAKREYEDPDRIPDRFGDDVDQFDFWFTMSKILYSELRKAIKKIPKESSQ